jgi:DNA-directed RNA polymerase subunit E'/Rpb7
MANSASYICEQTILNYKVQVPPNAINKDINNYILKKIKSNIEGICIETGFIEKVIKIIAKSKYPIIYDSDFEANCEYNVQILVNICSPKKDELLECIITANDNNMGAAICYQKPFFCIVMNDILNPKLDIKNLKIGDYIKVKIQDCRIKFADTIVEAVSIIQNTITEKEYNEAREARLKLQNQSLSPSDTIKLLEDNEFNEPFNVLNNHKKIKNAKNAKNDKNKKPIKKNVKIVSIDDSSDEDDNNVDGCNYSDEEDIDDIDQEFGDDKEIKDGDDVNNEEDAEEDIEEDNDKEIKDGDDENNEEEEDNEENEDDENADYEDEGGEDYE